MALENATQWSEQAEEWMVERLRDYSPPESLADCLADDGWARIFYAYLQANMANENVDFLWAVDGFRQSNDATVAQQVYDDYVSPNAPNKVNLYEGNQNDLDALFSDRDQVLTSLDMFDSAYGEVFGVLENDSYQKFQLVAGRVRQELAGQGGGADAEEPVEVGSPQQVEITRDMVDDSVVDSYNEQALKALDEGYSTNVWQLGDLGIIAADMETNAQPYVKWIRAQEGVVTGMITMVKKGRGLDPGSISVNRTGDRAAFEAAIARVSKKKVKYQ